MLRAVLTGSLLMLPAIAAAQDVKIDFDKAFDFSTVKTYSIKIGTPGATTSSQRRVLTEIDEAIAGKGWKKVDEGQANIHVILHGATQTKHNATTFYRAWAATATAALAAAWARPTTVVNEYTVGMLVVDMFDAKSKNLVFRGTAEDEISDNPDKNAKRLEKASTKMFKDFPPPARSSAVTHPGAGSTSSSGEEPMTVKAWTAMRSRPALVDAGRNQPRRVRASRADDRCRTAGTRPGTGATDERAAGRGDRR